MTSRDLRRPALLRSNVNDAFLRTKIGKLEKRLKHQRAAGKTLTPDSILMIMNDRVIFEMETKLFKLKRAAEPPGSGLSLEISPTSHSA